MRTEVAIIGAGPAGLLLSHLLALEGIESVVIEARPRECVESRIHTGVLESSTAALLESAGLGERLRTEGEEHCGIYLQWPGGREHIDFLGLAGRTVWVYAEAELTRDFSRARDAAGQRFFYRASGTAVHDVDGEHPYVTFQACDGRRVRIDADAIAGCDGALGACRAAVAGAVRGTVPVAVRQTWERGHRCSWLGIVADVAPSTDHLIYAWHPDGFALHSKLSRTVSQLFLQVEPDTDAADWPDGRIWDALATRLGHGQDGWELAHGPITDKSVLPIRSHVLAPMRRGRLFLAGSAAHIVPPTGAKALNLAIADVAALAPALTALLHKSDGRLADAYSDTALRHVWRGMYFSWWLTTMLHTTADPFDAQLQLAQVQWVASSPAGAAGLAENYTGPLAARTGAA